MADGVEVARQAAADIESWLRRYRGTVGVINVEANADFQQADIDSLLLRQWGRRVVGLVNQFPSLHFIQQFPRRFGVLLRHQNVGFAHEAHGEAIGPARALLHHHHRNPRGFKHAFDDVGFDLPGGSVNGDEGVGHGGIEVEGVPVVILQTGLPLAR